MRSRRFLLALALALGAFWLAAPGSRAEQAQDTASPEQTGAPEAEAAAPQGAPRRASARRTPAQWWDHAREVLLEGLALSEEQSQQVDEIISSQVEARRRSRDLQDELRLAKRENDAQRGATLRAELRANRVNLKDPAARIEEIRSLLTEEQHPAFDMNRARLVAESQQSRDAQRRRPKRGRGGAAPKAETE